MTVYIYEIDVLDKMNFIEQDEMWLERQRTDAIGPCTFLVFYNEWTKTWKPLQSKWDLETLRRGHVYDPRHGDVAIYGSCGWNRYCVRGEGSLLFLPEFARHPEDLERVKQIGIDILP